MDKLITSIIWKLRKRDPTDPGNHVNADCIETGGGSYQIFIPTKGCNNACSMCNYGFGHDIKEEAILQEVQQIGEMLPKNTRNIILETSGSFLDKREIPEELQYEVMKILNKTEVPMVTIETHYSTITQANIQEIKKIFPQKEIAFELGVESTNQEVLSIYNKDIDLKSLIEVIWESYQNGISMNLNLMVGVPFLTPKEQIEDAIQSIQWVLDNCPSDTEIVLFPFNIKDFTLVKYWYEKGRYDIISHWEFIEVLKSIPKKELGRVYISWWGNRVNIFHGEKRIIHPKCCSNCKEPLQSFYQSFVEARNSWEKKAKLIEEIESYSCSCREEFNKELDQKGRLNLSYTERWENEKERLAKEAKESF